MKHLFPALLAALGLVIAVPAGAVAADNGNALPTLSFFSGGGGAHAGWVHTDDQPAGDTDQQAIQIHDTTTGYAGVLVHHVYGWPTLTFPDSKFDFKSNLVSPSSLGYPRLEILFSDGGDASLRPLTWQQTWTTVAGNNWDNNHRGCGFLFGVTWQAIQACHPGTFITNAYITTDPGIEVDFLIDNLTVAGRNFSRAADNGNGTGTDGADNTTATFTPDLLSLLANPVVVG
jgi:hypothetical protein